MVSNLQPALTVSKFVAMEGVYPANGGGGGGMTLGMIRTFAGNFDPGADLLAQGQLLSISQYDVLFNVIGTTYGGNGQTTFALPNETGRPSVSQGQGPGLANYYEGQTFGQSSLSFTQANLPASSGGTSSGLQNQQPTLATQYLIRLVGSFVGSPDTTPIAEIVEFSGNYAPGGYAACNGQLLPINQNQALFALLGTTYGGNGTTTFALPDLRGRTPIGVGTANGQTVALGQQVGAATINLQQNQMPAGYGGSGASVDNREPGLGLTYLIATQGVYPTRDDGSAPDDGHYIGEIILYAGSANQMTDHGWAICDGHTLSIAQNTALFSLLGTQYGGNGQTTFALPDLRDRVAVGQGVFEGTSQTVGTFTGAGTFIVAPTDIPPLTITGTTSGDVFYGGTFADTLNGGGGPDVLYGNEGNDLLIGGAGADQLFGGGGTDTADYSASAAAVAINLLAGTAVGGDAQGDGLNSVENLIGSAFNDVLTGDGAANMLTGGAGDDTLSGGLGADVLNGGVGADVLYGNQDNDILYGNQDNDVLYGGQGNDVAYGGQGDDVLFGNLGDDLLYGNLGNDTLNGGVGINIMDGGDGIDTASYADAAAGVNVSLLLQGSMQDTGVSTDNLTNIENLTGSAYNDTLTGDANANVLTGGTGADTLSGGAGADVLYGNQDNDVLYGNQDNDTLYGGQGDDVLYGGQGDDVLVGGLGVDQIYGGLGADRILYTQAADSTPTAFDTLADFSGAQGDKIDLHLVRTGTSDSYSLSSAGGLTTLTVDLGGDGVIDMKIVITGSVTTADVIF